jgi:hypothetical protein
MWYFSFSSNIPRWTSRTQKWVEDCVVVNRKPAKQPLTNAGVSAAQLSRMGAKVAACHTVPPIRGRSYNYETYEAQGKGYMDCSSGVPQRCSSSEKRLHLYKSILTIYTNGVQKKVQEAYPTFVRHLTDTNRQKRTPKLCDLPLQ